MQGTLVNIRSRIVGLFHSLLEWCSLLRRDRAVRTAALTGIYLVATQLNRIQPVKDDPPLYWLLFALATIAYLYVVYLNSAKVILQERREFWRSMEHVLELAAKFQYPDRRRRANVMMPVRVGSPIGREFRIMCGWQMRYYEDRNIRIPGGRGATGRAFAGNLQVLVDRTQAEWQLPAEAEARVPADLRCVLSTPIRHPENDDVVIGVLNIDSFQQEDVETFRTNEYSHAVRVFADHLGRLMTAFRGIIAPGGRFP